MAFMDYKTRYWMGYCPTGLWHDEWMSLGNKPYDSPESADEFEDWCFENKPVKSTYTVNFIIGNKKYLTDDEFKNAMIDAMEMVRNNVGNTP